MTRRGGGSERAQALVPVVFVVMILTAFAVTLAGVARREMRAGAAELRSARMHMIARGALDYAAVRLQTVTGGGLTAAQLSLPPDTDANGWSQLGDGWYKIDIIDTGSRVNVNTASADALVRVPGLSASPATVAAIVDWRDADDTPTNLDGAVGAELEYYNSLNPPYAAKNAPFDTIEELLLVRGVTANLLFGARDASGGLIPLAQNPIQVASRQTGDPINTADAGVPLAEMLTTYSRERNVASDGTKRVNLKTADAEALVQLGLNPNLAQRLIQARGQNGANLNSIADLLNISGFTRELMSEIGDKLTVTDGEYRDGMINLNTAPEGVLAAIPGVDQATYSAVIEARNSGTVFTGLNDLFRLTALNRQQLQTLVDNVSVKSSVYLVRLKVRARGSSEVRAYQALVEVEPEPEPEEGAAAGSSQTQASIYQFHRVGRNPGWLSWTTGVFATGGSIGL
ncbi:MAG: general secretion pathway protein GspK [Chthonomonadales bacterium]|nr:general secretion pathway protein GspK [Chthonomonadales bacterium]